ncbi:hypothetical protein BDK51DRAFT_26620 [Blyttiomyces helicus]|uniref:Uncharacterized protein n=1 Tax=Blyttiomyces helicus TaxID=388810 RepID=A0A4P9WPD3_9FUNG|nr:hypothetical protein BDK51DRAFT_26620 [Blyttiomyces helicus]|eukprot:RKO93100.1 hypothetical protein BDK51DRAFT_26620 [Blyttiomyces helicus]
MHISTVHVSFALPLGLGGGEQRSGSKNYFGTAQTKRIVFLICGIRAWVTAIELGVRVGGGSSGSNKDGSVGTAKTPHPPERWRCWTHGVTATTPPHFEGKGVCERKGKRSGGHSCQGGANASKGGVSLLQKKLPQLHLQGALHQMII